MLIYTAQQRACCILLAGIACLCPFIKSGLNLSEHFRLFCIHRIDSPHRILFPLPETAPLPHIPGQIVIVFRNLLVRSDLVMKPVL